jgi:SAM-dependent methyltransferase
VLTHLPGVTQQAKVYCADRGPNARLVRHAFPGAVLAESPAGSSARLAFGDASLDCIVALDTLQHEPDVRAALREMARCLRPFGWLLMTPTLHFDRATTLTRATKDERGGITHIEPPVHHPDPAGGPGLLRFHDFGWDLLSMLRESGFSSAEIVVYTAPHYGYVGLQYVILAGRGRDKVPEIAAPKPAAGEAGGHVAR